MATRRGCEFFDCSDSCQGKVQGHLLSTELVLQAASMLPAHVPQGSANGLLHLASGALAESVHSGTVSSSRVVSHPDLPPSAAARVVLIRCPSLLSRMPCTPVPVRIALLSRAERVCDPAKNAR